MSGSARIHTWGEGAPMPGSARTTHPPSSGGRAWPAGEFSTPNKQHIKYYYYVNHSTRRSLQGRAADRQPPAALRKENE